MQMIRGKILTDVNIFFFSIFVMAFNDHTANNKYCHISIFYYIIIRLRLFSKRICCFPTDYLFFSSYDVHTITLNPLKDFLPVRFFSISCRAIKILINAKQSPTSSKLYYQNAYIFIVKIHIIKQRKHFTVM